MTSLLVRLIEQPFISRSLDRYRAMDGRDRIALVGLSVFLFLVFISYGLWIPLTNYVSESTDRHANRLELLQWMQSTEDDARAASGVVPESSRSGQSLLTLVSRTSQSTKVKPARLQPEGSDEVSVWFETVEFNQLLMWMNKLRQEGISVRQLSIDRQEVEGTVNARVVLRT